MKYAQKGKIGEPYGATRAMAGDTFLVRMFTSNLLNRQATRLCEEVKPCGLPDHI